MRPLERFAITRGSRRSPRHVDVRIAVLYMTRFPSVLNIHFFFPLENARNQKLVFVFVFVFTTCTMYEWLSSGSGWLLSFTFVAASLSPASTRDMLAKTAAVLAVGSAAAFAPGAVPRRAPSIRASVAPLRVVANSEPRRQFLANVGAFAFGAAIITTNEQALALSPPENNGVVPGSEDDPYSSNSIMKQVL